MNNQTISKILDGFPIEMLDPLDLATEKAIADWFKKVRKTLLAMKISNNTTI